MPETAPGWWYLPLQSVVPLGYPPVLPCPQENASVGSLVIMTPLGTDRDTLEIPQGVKSKINLDAMLQRRCLLGNKNTIKLACCCHF